MIAPPKRRLILVLAAAALATVVTSIRLAGQEETGWRISPININIQAGAQRPLQVLDDNAQELAGAEWSIDDTALASIREEKGQAIVDAKAAGTIHVTAAIHGEKRTREIVIWPQDRPLPTGTSAWGTHPIGREIADIVAMPTGNGPNTFSLEQTPAGRTYLRGVREDGIQSWAWLLPEDTRDVDLVCGDFFGGALISANRPDSYTLYTVGQDGATRWQHKLPGRRKAHAYTLTHVIHILSQSSDGQAARLTGFNEQTGDRKFELAVPPSEWHLTNLKKAGDRLSCAPDTTSIPVPTAISGLFVDPNGLAYLAFAQSEWTWGSPPCRANAAPDPHKVIFSTNDRLVLWQIHDDGAVRSTTLEETRQSLPLSESSAVSAPTGAIIPDGLDGVLLSVRKSPAALTADQKRPAEEFVYRLNPEGAVVYRFNLPRYEGKLHDDMVLGEDGLGFVARGGALVAYNVPEGKELWRWTSPQPVEILAALHDGACLVQLPSAVFRVASPTDARKVLDGRVMMDWQGRMYRKHN